MVKYRCEICKRDFTTAGGLTRHANTMHHGKTTLSQPHSHELHSSMPRPDHDENLWNMPITNTSSRNLRNMPITSTSSENLRNIPITPRNDPTTSQDDIIIEDIEDTILEDEPRNDLQSQQSMMEIEEIEETLEDGPHYNLQSQQSMMEIEEIVEESEAEEEETESQQTIIDLDLEDL
jgi:hypothetical protein